MVRQKNKTSYQSFIYYGLISVLVHLILLFIFSPTDSPKLTKSLNKPKRFSIKLQKKLKKKRKKVEIDHKNRQIVDIAKPFLERLPKTAKYLSKFNSKVKKETKAKKKNNVLKKKVNRKDTKAKKIAKRKRPKTIPKKSIKQQVNKKEKQLDTPKKQVKNIKPNTKQENQTKKSITAPENIRLNFSDHQFSNMLQAASNDYLKEVDEGEYTSLNTLAYEYTGYFLKIKNKVSMHWNPEAAYQQNDPYRKIYGIKDRYTVLLITINAKGNLNKIKIQKTSGLSFLDQEAIQAFEKGQPYTVVPAGLIKDKKEFTIQFGFYVDNPSSPKIFYLK